jgi:hypothetical protein
MKKSIFRFEAVRGLKKNVETCLDRMAACESDSLRGYFHAAEFRKDEFVIGTLCFSDSEILEFLDVLKKDSRIYSNLGNYLDNWQDLPKEYRIFALKGVYDILSAEKP